MYLAFQLSKDGVTALQDFLLQASHCGLPWSWDPAVLPAPRVLLPDLWEVALTLTVYELVSELKGSLRGHMCPISCSGSLLGSWDPRWPVGEEVHLFQQMW